MMIIPMIGSRDQVCASSNVITKSLHFVLSRVSSLHGRKAPSHLNSPDNHLGNRKTVPHVPWERKLYSPGRRVIGSARFLGGAEISICQVQGNEEQKRACYATHRDNRMTQTIRNKRKHVDGTHDHQFHRPAQQNVQLGWCLPSQLHMMLLLLLMMMMMVMKMMIVYTFPIRRQVCVSTKL